MRRVFGAFNSYNKKETIFRMEKKICNIMKPENQDKVIYRVKKKKKKKKIAVTSTVKRSFLTKKIKVKHSKRS